MKKLRLTLPVLAAFLALTLVLSGCNDREDTRQYINTIGVVFTNDLEVVFDELYVYPGSLADMGPDFIKNTKNNVKVGSYGVTLEREASYSVWLKDRRGGSYEYENVPLENADHAIISYDAEQEMLTLTIHHFQGGSTLVEGRFVPPDDAPEYDQVPLTTKESYAFDIVNSMGNDLEFISMREANDQYKGEVELYLRPLTTGSKATVSGKLGEEDTEITEWVLYVETTDDRKYTSEMTFDPWTTKSIELTLKSGNLILETEAD